MKLVPLTGQVLIEVLSGPKSSPGGIVFPATLPMSPEAVQESHRNPQKPAKPSIGIVRACGPWPKTRKGLLLMPEFGVGSKVAFNPWHGTDMQRNGQRLKLVAQDDVLAVITQDESS